MWDDPAGHGPQRPVEEEYELPAKGGGVEKHKRIIAPPIAWRFQTDQAIAIQRSRDTAGGLLAVSPIERLDAYGKRLDAWDSTGVRVSAVLESLLRLPMPEKTENLILTIHRMKREIGECATALRSAMPKPENAGQPAERVPGEAPRKVG